MKYGASPARIAAALAACLFLPLTAHAQQTSSRPELTQVYLVQNSGWMEPFYADRGSQFRSVVTSLIESTRIEGVDVIVATFNQNGQIPGHTSPEQVFAGPYDRERIGSVITAIEPPRRPDGKYADSDFFGALNGTANDLTGGRQAIIWMITNNKASPNNSQEVIQNTGKFYASLRDTEQFRKIVAFPIRMQVHGPHYNEFGFIVYGIAYGELASKALSFLIADDQPVRKFFTDPPVRVKPLDQDPLRLELTAQSLEPVDAALEQGVLTLRHVPGSSESEVRLIGRLVNSYYPQEIQAAVLSAGSSATAGAPSIDAQISPKSIQGLPPRATLGDVVLDLRIPAVRRSSIFQDHAQAQGYLYIRLSDARLGLGRDFVSRMKDVFGINLLMRDQKQAEASQLPEVFFDYQRVKSATTAVPIVVVYDFSPWPLILASVGGILVLGLLGGGGVLAVLPRAYSVRVGSSTVKVKLRPFEERIVQAPSGVRAKVRGPLLGKPAVEVLGNDTEAVNKVHA